MSSPPPRASSRPWACPLIRGREFQDADTNAVVITQSLARAFWPWKDPVGQTLTFPDGLATIVGVVRDVEPLRFGGSENPAVYRMRHPSKESQLDGGAVRPGASTAPPRSGPRSIRPLPDIMPLARLLQGWILEMTETLWNVVALIVVLGLVATALATTGIYGAVSFAVSQRTRELGIRVALGATRFDIFRSVLISGGKPVAQGLVVGLWLSVMMAGGLRQSVQGSPLRLDTSNPLLVRRRGGIADRRRAVRDDRAGPPGSEGRPPGIAPLRVADASCIGPSK